MTNYQKAIKVKKVCENKIFCDGMDDCPYLDKCRNSTVLLYSPSDENIETVAKAIKKEKWNIK